MADPMGKPDLRCRPVVVEPRQYACVQSNEVSTKMAELRRVRIKRRTDRHVAVSDDELQPLQAERSYLQALFVQFGLKPDRIDLEYARNRRLEVEIRAEAPNA